MNSKLKSIGIKVNPFYLYSIALISILLMYNLNWSELYPKISFTSYIFFVITIIITTILGYHLQKKLDCMENIKKNELNVNFITIIIVILLVADFIYAKSIPLVEIAIIKKANYTHFDFRGIPLFHGFLISFISFFAIYLFDKFLSEKNLKYLYLFLINLLPSILLYNRGMFTMILISCLSVFAITKLKSFINLKYIIILIIPILIFLYGFGVAGNLRQNKDIKDINKIYTNSDYIMYVGEASENFKSSIVPKSFFWSYLYMTSPLANLENTIQSKPPYVAVNLENTIKFLNYSILPNFISEKLNIPYEEATLITPSLTVSTAFSEAYTFLGWIGIIALFIYWILMVFVYIIVMPKSSAYFITGISVLNTITVLNFFDNMMVFSPLSFQLIYPILFMLIFEKDIISYYYKKFKRKLG